MKTILISGGAGFIGSRLALKLLEKDYSITILDNLSPQIHGNNPDESPLYIDIRDKCRFIRGDVRDREAWVEALKGIDTVLHFAAETGTGQSMYEINK